MRSPPRSWPALRRISRLEAGGDVTDGTQTRRSLAVTRVSRSRLPAAQVPRATSVVPLLGRVLRVSGPHLTTFLTEKHLTHVTCSMFGYHKRKGRVTECSLGPGEELFGIGAGAEFFRDPSLKLGFRIS